MRFFKSTLGFMLAGMLVMSIWGEFAIGDANLGGWLAGLIIIGTMWFLNHYVGLIENLDSKAFVDMGWGIAWTGLLRDVFMKGGGAFVESLPTIGLVTVGAILAGFVINLINKYNESKVTN
ncbi:MAG: hypothetical protein GX752_06930 [Clostridium sp.]|nr:hypothetical protein [Clostridium sp.]